MSAPDAIRLALAIALAANIPLGISVAYGLGRSERELARARKALEDHRG